MCENGAASGAVDQCVYFPALSDQRAISVAGLLKLVRSGAAKAWSQPG